MNTQDQLAKSLITALGLEGRGVRAITLDMAHGLPTTATVIMNVYQSQLEAVQWAVEKYELNPTLKE
jgi:hypothetical protein